MGKKNEDAVAGPELDELGAIKIDTNTSLFHGLGFEDADELVMKAELLEAISERVQARGYNKGEAATAMGLNRTEASHLLSGHLGRFTIDRLVRALQHLDPSVYVRVAIAQRETPDAART